MKEILVKSSEQIGVAEGQIKNQAIKIFLSLRKDFTYGILQNTQGNNREIITMYLLIWEVLYYNIPTSGHEMCQSLQVNHTLMG